MIDQNNVPDVSESEIIARFILSQRNIGGNQKVSPNAFMPPPPNFDLSVSRHLSTTETELWGFGRTVAAIGGKTLYGRADIGVATCKRLKLRVEKDPIDDATENNPNHAVVIDWPNEKHEQKIIAQELAAVSIFVPVATSSE